MNVCYVRIKRLLSALFFWCTLHATSLSGRFSLLLLVREVLRARPRESVVKWRIALRLPNAFNEYIQKTSWHAELSLPLAKNENAEDFKTCFCTRTESS